MLSKTLRTTTCGALFMFACATGERLTPGDGGFLPPPPPDGGVGTGGVPTTGGAPGTGGIPGTGGLPGNGGTPTTGGSGGAMTGGTGGVVGSGGSTQGDSGSDCGAGLKRCGGICTEPNPGNGCGLTGCTSCTAPPANSFRICSANQCDFECFDGFRLNDAGDGCEPDPDAGAGGSGGTGGTGGAGGTGGSGGSGGGTGGTPPTCNPSTCTNSCAGPRCCKADGTCGCNTFWIPVCG